MAPCRIDARYSRFAFHVCVLTAVVAAAVGCNDTTPQPVEGPFTARQQLDRMVEAYRKAKTYTDSGQLKLSYRKEGGEVVSQAADDSVTFSRPNKLRMHCYQAIVVADGKKLQATIADLPGQVLSIDAPKVLKRDDLLNDEILTGVLTQGLAGESIQLALLLMHDPLQPILEGGEEPTLLASRAIDGDDCHRVQVVRPDGAVVFWIDHKNALRRLEFPTTDLKKEITKHEQAPVSDVSLVAEFKGAKLNEHIAEVAFEFAAPEGAQLVERFQVQPEPMHRLLGKKLGEFAFVDLDGKRVTPESLSGKVVVIDFWATWCGWCFKGLPNLQTVYDQYRDNDKVQIIAVSTDEPGVSDADLASKFAEAKLSIPIARDVAQQAQTIFDVQGLPSMFILGADGSVQDIDVGFQPQLAVELPRKIDRLLAGQSLYEEARRQHEARQKAFEESLAAGNPDNADSGAIPHAKIAEASPPRHLPLTPAWHSDEVTNPGNILPVDDSDGNVRLLINDGWRTVVALDENGKVADRYELDIPTEAAVSYLRTGIDEDGNRFFAGSASAQQQVFLFSRDFKRLSSYPEGEHAGISDIRLADMDGDGQLDVNIGYWGVVGVQSVTIDGQRRWVDRSLENVFCLAVTEQGADGHRGLIAADGRGMLVPINDEGKDAQPMSVSGRFLRWVVLADQNGDGEEECCAIASSKVGVESVVGLSRTGELKWTYDLPVGAQPNPGLEMLVAGRLSGENGQWIVAGADGSIHILDAEGTLVDKFHVGAAVSGLAVARLDGRGTLLVATEKGVDAWQSTDE